MGHHYVPQKYLSGFTDPSRPGELWQFDKKALSFSELPVPIKTIAQEPSFYSTDTERQLNEIVEGPGNRVLDKLRSGDFSLQDQERVALSGYIATMLTRVPHHRSKAASMVPGALKKATSELREQVRAAEDAGQISPEIAAEHLTELDAGEVKLASETPDDVRELIRSPWPTGRMIDCVYSMHWRFISADGDDYILVTDNPAFFFESDGIATESSEWTFPVSRSLVIFGSWTPIANRRATYRRTQLVKEANRRLISYASRFVYSRGKDDWIRKVAARNQPNLSRVKW